MVDLSRPPDSATYEIRLRGEIPVAMREEFPAMTIYHRPAETVLYRDVTDLAELDVLLEQLQSMGLVLSEIREVPAAAPSGLGTSRGEDDDD
jgi:hypothetical protein